MKTKIFLVILFLVISATLSFSQKNTFSIHAGANMHYMRGLTSSGEKLAHKPTIGFQAGIGTQIPVAPEFYLQPGVQFSTRGSRDREADPGVKYLLSYLEIPLSIVYKGPLDIGQILFGLGPYMGFAVGGSSIDDNDIKQNIVYTIVVEETDPVTSTYFRPFDAGINVFGGYEQENGIFYQLNAQVGLLKINPENKIIEEDKAAIRNICFSISVGYCF